MNQRTITEEQEDTRRRVSPLRLAIGSVVALVLLVTMVLLTNGTWQPMEVISSSMEPTLERGDRVIVRSLEREDPVLTGDIVTFTSPVDLGAPIVKRVAATPGDTVEVRNRQLLVNGAASPWPAGDLSGGVRLSRIRLADDEYFMVGENSRRSEDSFHFGPIHREHILGRVWWRYAPGGRRGKVQ